MHLKNQVNLLPNSSFQVKIDVHKRVLLCNNMPTVLKIIKDAQGQHGLRYGDYQRYRSPFSTIFLIYPIVF